MAERGNQGPVTKRTSAVCLRLQVPIPCPRTMPAGQGPPSSQHKPLRRALSHKNPGRGCSGLVARPSWAVNPAAGSGALPSRVLAVRWEPRGRAQHPQPAAVAIPVQVHGPADVLAPERLRLPAPRARGRGGSAVFTLSSRREDSMSGCAARG